MKLIATLLSTFFTASAVYASFLEVCDVEAKVESIEELSLFGAGSVNVPSGVNPDGEAQYTFKRLASLHVVEAKADGGHTDCQLMVGKTYRVILDSKDLLKESVGDVLPFQRRQINSMTPNGVAYGETWSMR